MRVLFVNIEHWQRLDAKCFFLYTKTMAGIDIGSVFDLLAYGLSKQKSSISEHIPTVADLEAEVEKLRASENSGSPGAPSSQEPSAPSTTQEKASSIASGCVPCSLGHLGTCSGLLNEAMRFARSDGVQSEEVIDRVNMCLDEIAALVRVDLRPEMTVNLPSRDKELANEILVGSRNISHKLEGINDVADLEQIAAEAQGLRQKIGKEWFQQRLSQVSPEANEK
jgi:hypothetical protein